MRLAPAESFAGEVNLACEAGRSENGKILGISESLEPWRLNLGALKPFGKMYGR